MEVALTNTHKGNEYIDVASEQSIIPSEKLKDDKNQSILCVDSINQQSIHKTLMQKCEPDQLIIPSEKLKDDKNQSILCVDSINQQSIHKTLMQKCEPIQVEQFTEDIGSLVEVAINEKTNDLSEHIAGQIQSIHTFKSLSDDIMKEEILKLKDTIVLIASDCQSSPLNIKEYKFKGFNNNIQHLSSGDVESALSASRSTLNASELWRRAGMGIKSKLNISSNKGLIGVIKQAEAQGKLKPNLFNRNISKAILAMAKKQSDVEKVTQFNDIYIFKVTFPYEM